MASTLGRGLLFIIVDMIKHFSIILLSIISISGYSQEKDNNTSNEHQSIIRLSFIAPGLLFEQQVKNNFTLTAGVKIGISYTSTNINGQRSSELEFYPAFVFEPRYYTTIARRKERGKQTDYFTSGYIGLPFYKGIGNDDFSVGVLYGFQGPISRRGFWNIGIGYGFVKTNGRRGSEQVIGDLGIGVVLN